MAISKVSSMVPAGDLKSGHLVHLPEDPPGRFRRITHVGHWNAEGDDTVVWFELGSALVHNTHKDVLIEAKTTR
jgi:hypothetical protein